MYIRKTSCWRHMKKKSDPATGQIPSLKVVHVGFIALCEETCPGDLWTIGAISKGERKWALSYQELYQGECGEMKSCPPPTSWNTSCSVNKGENCTHLTFISSPLSTYFCWNLEKNGKCPEERELKYPGTGALQGFAWELECYSE